MRVTVDSKTLSDGRGPRQPTTTEWWLLDEGLDGWTNAPAPRATSDPVPDGDGGYWPARFLLAPRTLTIRGAHTSESSSLARAEAEDWLASLDGEISVVVEDEHGTREVTGFQSAIPTHRRIDDLASEFTLFITAPDPIKYGTPALFREGYVENTGRTPVLPWRIVANGNVTRLRVTIGGHVIRWTGLAGGIVIDCRTGTATEANGIDRTTGLVEDDIPYIPPGRMPLTIETDAEWAAVEVRPGWR
jgi:hypothetical protein